MYFKNIFNIEAQQLCRQERVDMTTNIGTINRECWEVEEIDNGNFVRIKPLFICSRISSSNPFDTVIEDNKCLICQNKMDTIITAEGVK